MQMSMESADELPIMNNWISNILDSMDEKKYKFVKSINDYKQMESYTDGLDTFIASNLKECKDEDIHHTQNTLKAFEKAIRGDEAMRWFIICGYKDAHEKYYKCEQEYGPVYQKINRKMLEKVKDKYTYAPGALDISNITLITEFLNELLKVQESQLDKDKYVYDTEYCDLLLIGLIIRGHDKIVMESYLKLIQNFINKHKDYDHMIDMRMLAYNILVGYDHKYTPNLTDWFAKIKGSKIPIDMIQEVKSFITEHSSELRESTAKKEGVLNQEYFQKLTTRVEENSEYGEFIKKIIVEDSRKVFNNRINAIKNNETLKQPSEELNTANGFQMMCNLHNKMMGRMFFMLKKKNLCLHCWSPGHDYGSCKERNRPEIGMGPYLRENYGNENNTRLGYYERLSTARDKAQFAKSFDPNYSKKRKYDSSQ